MEPATKQDLKDLLKEFREEFRESIKEAVAEAFGNSKPALEHATTPAASQLLSTDAPASHTTIVDVVPVLAASAASTKPLDIDATGVAAEAPTICSTDDLKHTADGDDPTAACQTAWSTPTSFIVPPGDSPTPSREPALGLALGALAHTTYSTEGSEVSANSMVRASMSGVARSAAVTTVLLVDILLDTAESHEVVPDITNSNGLGEELRPRPWPSFNCSQEGFPASCSDWMSEIKNLVSYGVQEYTVNNFSERHLCGPVASYLVLINFWAMGTGYLQILQQLGNIELKENQLSNNIDEQWPGQLVFLCSISDVMAYCFMPDSHSVGLVLSSVICEVVVPPVQYVPRLLCMQPITHKNEATSTLLMGLSAWGVPWDPGDLRIVFEDIHGERNTHFVRQVLLTIPCSSLMDGVEFSTSCGQAPFQGGRNFMILTAFVDHNYYLDAVLNLVPASHDEYRDPVRVNSGHGCDYEGYFGNPGEQAYYFGRVYIDLNYYHEDYHGDPSKIKELQAPWDPGKSAFQSPAKFWLGVKPSFKEGGVLATCPLGGPATTRRHQGPAHHQLPVLHGLHIQQGRQRRGHPGMDQNLAAAAISPTPGSRTLIPFLLSSF